VEPGKIGTPELAVPTAPEGAELEAGRYGTPVPVPGMTGAVPVDEAGTEETPPAGGAELSAGLGELDDSTTGTELEATTTGAELLSAGEGELDGAGGTPVPGRE
jgi:hypothetical protein